MAMYTNQSMSGPALRKTWSVAVWCVCVCANGSVLHGGERNAASVVRTHTMWNTVTRSLRGSGVRSSVDRLGQQLPWTVCRRPRCTNVTWWRVFGGRGGTTNSGFPPPALLPCRGKALLTGGRRTILLTPAHRPFAPWTVRRGRSDGSRERDGPTRKQEQVRTTHCTPRTIKLKRSVYSSR